MNHVKIRKFAYLKTPKYHWTFLNDVGGSFSNSGEYTSFNKCIAHARQVNGISIPVKTYAVDGEGNETFIADMSNCEEGK